MPVTGHCQSKPKLFAALTLDCVRMVSFCCHPVRLLSLCQVVTLWPVDNVDSDAKASRQNAIARRLRRGECTEASSGERFERGPNYRGERYHRTGRLSTRPTQRVVLIAPVKPRVRISDTGCPGFPQRTRKEWGTLCYLSFGAALEMGGPPSWGESWGQTGGSLASCDQYAG